jgi:hypothetical protein
VFHQHRRRRNPIPAHASMPVQQALPLQKKPTTYDRSLDPLLLLH